MKIEMNEETATCIGFVAFFIACTLIALMIYRYNALAFEQGYTQVQLKDSLQTVWVKGAQTNQPAANR